MASTLLNAILKLHCTLECSNTNHRLKFNSIFKGCRLIDPPCKKCFVPTPCPSDGRSYTTGHGLAESYVKAPFLRLKHGPFWKACEVRKATLAPAVWLITARPIPPIEFQRLAVNGFGLGAKAWIPTRVSQTATQRAATFCDTLWALPRFPHG